MSLKFYLLNLPALVLTWCIRIQLCGAGTNKTENDPFNFLFLKNVPKTHFRREIIRCMLVTAAIWQPDRVRLLTNINHLKRPELRWTASNTDEDCLALARAVELCNGLAKFLQRQLYQSGDWRAKSPSEERGHEQAKINIFSKNIIWPKYIHRKTFLCWLKTNLLLCHRWLYCNQFMLNIMWQDPRTRILGQMLVFNEYHQY